MVAKVEPEKSLEYDEKDDSTFDTILVEVGQFGPFQWMVIALTCVPLIFNAFSLTFVFSASTVVHRCNISECDTATSQYHEPWTEYTIPIRGTELDQCKRYSSRYAENETMQVDICLAENFNNAVMEKCPTDNLIYRDKEVTISNEFGIFCSEEWKLTLVGTINNAGSFVGIPLGGFFSDKYGRSASIALGGFLAAILGIIRSFSPNYIFFVIFEFLESVACSTLYATCFIVGIELVGPKRRIMACSIITMCYAFGEMLLALVAKNFQNWRVLLRILYIPALVHFAYFWILPESVRWLLSLQQEERASKILKRAAAINKRELSESALEKLLSDNRNKLQSSNESKFPIREAFRLFFWRIANCSFCWIVHALVYFGLSMNAVLLNGDKYNNFIYIALVEIPGYLIPFLIMDRMGRRYSLCMLLGICGVCCLGTIFVGTGMAWLELTLFLVGKLAITASFQVLYFFTSEIFPTNLRNSLLSLCSMVGRIGAMIAPQTPLLSKFYVDAPAIVFGTSAVISAALCLFFPETTNSVLPTTMKEADNIGAKKMKKELI